MKHTWSISLDISLNTLTPIPAHCIHDLTSLVVIIFKIFAMLTGLNYFDYLATCH